MQPISLAETATLQPEGTGVTCRHGAWYSWDSPVGLGLALISCGIAFALFGVALLFIRHAIIG